MAQNRVCFGIVVTVGIPDLHSNCMQQLNKLYKSKHSTKIFIFR